MTTERVKFEAWAKAHGYDIVRSYPSGSYKASNTSVGWGAWQASLQADQRLANLTVLVKRLVRAVRKTSPDSGLAFMAMSYLERSGLTGSPLRDVNAFDTPSAP